MTRADAVWAEALFDKTLTGLARAERECNHDGDFDTAAKLAAAYSIICTFWSEADQIVKNGAN